MNNRHLRSEDLAGRRWRGLVRESTQAQADKWSPERQRSDIRRAAERLGLVGDDIWYERVGSGEAEGAPELEEALADARVGAYDVLIAFSTSRFARNVGEARRLKAEFRRAGVVIYFVAENLISGTYAAGISEGVHEVLDEHANEERRLYISGGIRQRQLAGRWVGTVPWGMRKVMVDRPDGSRGWGGDIEPDPAIAPIIRRIYDAAATDGVQAIATMLNADGVRSANGLPWSARAVGRVLENPAYAGRLVRYRERSSKHYYDHPTTDGHTDLGVRFAPVVDAGLWDAVADIRRRRDPGGIHAGRINVYPLSGTARCASCGHKMTGVAAHGQRYYRCVGHYEYRTCGARSVRAERLELAFGEWLGSHRLAPDWRDAIAHSRVDRFRTNERDRRAVLETRLTRVRQQFEWGDLEADDYRAKVAEIKAEMGTIVKPSMTAMETVAGILSDLGSAWLDASPEAQATIPPLVLKAAEVDRSSVTWVVHASLRPLLELCVATPPRLETLVPRYTVRYSA